MARHQDESECADAGAGQRIDAVSVERIAQPDQDGIALRQSQFGVGGRAHFQHDLGVVCFGRGADYLGAGSREIGVADARPCAGPRLDAHLVLRRQPLHGFRISGNTRLARAHFGGHADPHERFSQGSWGKFYRGLRARQRSASSNAACTARASAAAGSAPARSTVWSFSARPCAMRSPNPPAPMKAAMVAVPTLITAEVLTPAMMVSRASGSSIL